MTIGHEKSGRPAYDREHIPGAAFLELQDDLSDPDAEFSYTPLPTDSLVAAFGRLGIGDETHVVLYDNSGSMWAAWAWWLLRSVGFDRAALLPSGVAQWREAGHPVTDQPTEYPPATLTPAPRPRALAGKDEVLAATEDSAVRIIDVLPPESYEGLFAMYDRPGHIASAINEPMGAISGDGFSLKSTEEIESGGRFARPAGHHLLRGRHRCRRLGVRHGARRLHRRRDLPRLPRGVDQEPGSADGDGARPDVTPSHAWVCFVASVAEGGIGAGEGNRTPVFSLGS